MATTFILAVHRTGRTIHAGKSILEEDFDETALDACLIAAGRRDEHEQMAAYGTLVAWAQAIGHTDLRVFCSPVACRTVVRVLVRTAGLMADPRSAAKTNE